MLTHRPILLLGVLILGFPSQLIAQHSDGQNSSDSRLEELIVRAQKRDQSIEEVPLSLSVLSGAYLDQRNLTTLEQVTASQPAVTVSKNSAASKLYVRGIGSQGNAGLDQSVSVFIDEIYHGRSRNSKLALVDLEQLEILKGPQSVYFGFNSSAGAIAVQTRKPELDEQRGYFRALIGTDDEQGLRAAYNLPVGEQFAVRLVADHSSSDGYWDMVDPQTGAFVGKGGGSDSSMARVSALWRPSDSFQADLKVETQSIERENPYAWQPGRCSNLYGLGLSTQAQLDSFWASTGSAQNSPLALPFTCVSGFADSQFDSRSPAAPFNSSDFDGREALLRLQWHWDDLELVSTTGYYSSDFGFAGNDLTHGAPQNRSFWLEDESSQISHEFRVRSLSTGALGWLAGAYWQSGDADYQTGDADGRNSRNPQFIRTQARQDEEVRSLFGELDWQIDDDWQASVGLRWSRTEKTFSGVDERVRSNTITGAQRSEFAQLVQTDVSGDPSAYTAFGRQTRGQFDSERRSFSDLTPSFKLRYQISDELFGYYRWTQGFKSGGFNFRLNGLDSSTLTYDPERVTANELGVKGLFFDGSLRLGAAIFVSDYRDLQQNSNRGDDGQISAAAIRNAAEASSDGVELELAWQINQAFRLDLSASWLDAQFDRYPGADCTRFQSVISNTDVAAQFGAERNGNRCSQDLAGGTLPHAPDFSSRMRVSHEAKLNSGWLLNSSLEWFYSSEFFTSPHADSLRMQSSHDKFNARVELADTQGQWMLALLANNLSNELTARQLGQDQDAAVSGLVDDPRRVSLQLLYNF